MTILFFIYCVLYSCFKMATPIVARIVQAVFFLPIRVYTMLLGKRKSICQAFMSVFVNY
jgi:hypothetical protein